MAHRLPRDYTPWLRVENVDGKRNGEQFYSQVNAIVRRSCERSGSIDE